ncbi:MAG: hypothetical protein JWL77_7042 [Chthonomonadaceae bacterium]|nr:hypothetical protein [Chthonomonadaceae bacterium]
MTSIVDDIDESTHRTRNAVWGSVALAGQALSFIVLAPLLGNTKGASVLGVWSLTSSILAWASLFDFGVGEATAQRVAGAGGRASTRPEVERLVRSGRYELGRYCWIAAVGLTPLLLGMAHVLADKSIDEIPLALYWLTTCFAFLGGLPATALSAVHIGRGEIWAQRIPLLAETVVTTMVSTLVLVPSANALLVLAMASLVGRASGIVVRREIFRRVMGWLPSRRVDRAEFSRKVGREFLLASLGTRILLASDTLILGLSAGIREVGAYAFTFRCAYTSMQVIWLLSDHAFAAMSRMTGTGDKKAAQKLLRHVVKQTLVLGSLTAICFSILARPMLALLGKNLLVPEQIVVLVAGFILVHSVVHVLGIAGQGLYAQRVVGRIVIVGALANLSLSLLLVAPYGASGLLIGTLTADLAISLPCLVVVCRRQLSLMSG